MKAVIHEESGRTLVEVLAAATILSLLLAGLLTAFRSAEQTTATGRYRDEASALAIQLMEEHRFPLPTAPYWESGPVASNPRYTYALQIQSYQGRADVVSLSVVVQNLAPGSPQVQYATLIRVSP